MTTHATNLNPRPVKDSGRWVIWTAGLIVALGAAVTTAHGLYEVAIAANVPEPIAWLYPLITDGLALVAYASTTRLAAGGRRYAWTVVVLAAGLSGLAQASYLAIGVHTAPAVLRAGVGAWPAVAAAITAHLLYLLTARSAAVQGRAVVQPVGRLDGAVQSAAVPGEVGMPRVGRPRTTAQVRERTPESVVQPHDVERPREVGRLRGPLPSAAAGMRDGDPTSCDSDLSRPSATTPRSGSPAYVHATAVQTAATVQQGVGRPATEPPAVVQPDVGRSVQPGDVEQPTERQPVQPAAPAADVGQPVEHPAVQPGKTVGQLAPDSGSDAPIDRATSTALAHRRRHDALPSVSQLAEAADVARGTAATALKRLRDSQAAERPGLHVVHDHQTGTSR